MICSLSSPDQSSALKELFQKRRRLTRFCRVKHRYVFGRRKRGGEERIYYPGALARCKKQLDFTALLLKFSLQLHLKTKPAILIPFKANQGFLLHVTRKIPSLDGRILYGSAHIRAPSSILPDRPVRVHHKLLCPIGIPVGSIAASMETPCLQPNNCRELVSLLQYMKSSTLDNPEILVKDQRLLNLDRIVQEVKETEEWEAVKMNILEIGLEQGIKQGRLQNLVKNVESAMKNFNIDLSRACSGLEISVEEYERAKAQIALWEKESQ